ncbi:unnamed protein product [Cylicocyclus nassatus]|uniref:Methyltransferase domain-containing protein n=1 Tax=Cylicocyclus nassatus TaxID=53992 RepID=A0AA36DR58_CYLNA|nr:unnamed protein product [Cylicocyclus nassatus]
MSTFPSIAYSDAKTEWIGQTHIVAPTIARALEDWSLINQKKVLDVGCGTGSIGHDILENGALEVVGLDSSKEMIEIAKNTYKDDRHKFLQMSVLDLDLSHEFDVAVSFFVLQFMKDKEELFKAIRNIFESLKETGILVAIVPNGVKDFNPKREEGQKFGAAINLESDSNLYDGRRLSVEFFSNGEVVGSSKVTFFFNETYEQVLKEAGFKKVEFLSPVISADGIEKYGEKHFQSFMNPPKDIVIRAYKY